MDLSLSDNQRLALPHKARGKPQRKHGHIRKQRAECEGLPTHYLACRESLQTASMDTWFAFQNCIRQQANSLLRECKTRPCYCQQTETRQMKQHANLRGDGCRGSMAMGTYDVTLGSTKTKWLLRSPKPADGFRGSQSLTPLP